LRSASAISLKAGVLSRTTDGRTEFPFETVKVEFVLQAA